MLERRQRAKPRRSPDGPDKMNYTHRTKPPRRAAPKAARAGAMIFSALARKTKYADPMLAENWPTIAGPKIGALCRPGRILGTKGRGNGRTLEIYPPSGAAAAELQMHLDDLIVRVNRFLGPGTIARITLIQAAGSGAGLSRGHNTSKTPAKTNPGEASAPLETALASFRAAVARKSDPENDKK